MLVVLTTFGMQHKKHSLALVEKILTMDDLLFVKIAGNHDGIYIFTTSTRDSWRAALPPMSVSRS